MSHQSGIQVSEELSQTFASAVTSGDIRALRVSIIKESLETNGIVKAEGSLEQGVYLEPTQPAYILLRLDEKAGNGEHQWLFMCYVPDNAKVREKMLYASSRATLIKALGDYRFIDSIYGTQENEFSYQGYKRHLAHKAADKPLTRREQELAHIKAAEAMAVSDYQGTAARKSYTSGVAFPLSQEAIDALKHLNKTKEERQHNFVVLHLNNEKIELDTASTVAVEELRKAIPSNVPRFSFYVFEHEHEGETKEVIVFVYTCPSSSKIREKMLYSSSKAGVITGAKTEADVYVVKKFETSDPEDVTSEYLLEDIYTSHTSSSGGSTPNGASSSLVADRIQMLGSKQGGFKRPSAPGRRRPAA
ncbi:hypothetical protein BDF14DRAFT_837581 [Spinellus fusiger]|nr:hypothetical protein BDF14DRAFT_837581 [Spinellus fusiger]